MKYITLLRHAHPIEDSKLVDFDRPLSPEGIKKCQQISNLLDDNHMEFDHIISSSAVRAVETVKNIFHKPADYHSRDLYYSSVEKLLHFLAHLDSKYSKILLVNHNPSITLLGQLFTKNSNGLEIIKGFSPGSMALYSCDLQSWVDLIPEKVNFIKFWQ